MDSIFNILNGETISNEATPTSNNETINEVQAEPESATIPADDTNNNLVESEDISTDALFQHIADVIADAAANNAAPDDQVANMTGLQEAEEVIPSLNAPKVLQEEEEVIPSFKALKVVKKSPLKKAKKTAIKTRIQPARMAARKATKISNKKAVRKIGKKSGLKVGKMSARNTSKKNVLRKTKKGKIMKQKKTKKVVKGRK